MRSRVFFLPWVSLLVFGMCLVPSLLVSNPIVTEAEEARSPTRTLDDLMEMDPFYRFSFSAMSGVYLPMKEDTHRIHFAHGESLIVHWNPSWFKHFFLRFSLDVVLFKPKIPIFGIMGYSNVGVVYPSFTFRLGKGFSVYTGVGGGFRLNFAYVEKLDIQNISSAFFLKGYVGMEYLLPRIPLSFCIEGNYSAGFDGDRPFPHLGITAGITFQLMDKEIRNLRKKRIEVLDFSVDSLFAALYMKYDDLPIGRVTIRNISDHSLSNVRAQFYIKTYMDSPLEGSALNSLEPGQTAEFSLNALFNQQLLEFTEDAEFIALIKILYTDRGEDKEYSFTQRVTIFHRNSMTWSDPAKLGSFITLNDEAIRSFARGVVTLFDNASTPVNDRLEEAAELFTALGDYGVQYVADPNTPFSKFSQKGNLLDTVNYPRETLMYKSGDCDDLTLLMSALLENIGIRTAFVTVPGHIFLLLDTGVAQDFYGEIHQDIGWIKIMDERVWVPIEATLIGRASFRKAWEYGAKQIQRWIDTEGLEIIRTADAQASYPAVALPPSTFQVILPNEDLLKEEITPELTWLFQQTVLKSVDMLEQELTADPENLNLLFELARIYFDQAKYEPAISLFERLLLVNKDHYNAHYYLGLSWYALEDYEAGQRELEWCIEHKPEDLRAYTALGLILDEK